MNQTILIVDDEKEIRELLRLYIEKDGYSVVQAENGVEALKQADSKQIDLVIIDIMMPELDGYKMDGSAKSGDTLTVGSVSLTVAGFLRDSAMNADVAGSKRFLVSENDFKDLESFGSMEYLIEFRLNDPAFQSDYFAARLPVFRDFYFPFFFTRR
ncbi:response regulator [Blautia schinkii]|nr:response regulator [Blautia schinkii]